MSCQDAHFFDRLSKTIGNNLAHSIICMVSTRRLPHRDTQCLPLFFNLLTPGARRDKHLEVHEGILPLRYLIFQLECEHVLRKES